jgi:hypothetical protein
MILYLKYGFGMVTCTVSPLSRFTAHLLPVYNATKHFSCLHKISITRGRSTGLPYHQRMKEPINLYKNLRLVFFWGHLVCLSVHTFLTDISAFTGRNDFIFEIWLWHGDLYRVSPFQVYRTSTSCLQCD